MPSSALVSAAPRCSGQKRLAGEDDGGNHDGGGRQRHEPALSRPLQRLGDHRHDDQAGERGDAREIAAVGQCAQVPPRRPRQDGEGQRRDQGRGPPRRAQHEHAGDREADQEEGPDDRVERRGLRHRGPQVADQVEGHVHDRHMAIPGCSGGGGVGVPVLGAEHVVSEGEDGVPRHRPRPDPPRQADQRTRWPRCGRSGGPDGPGGRGGARSPAPPPPRPVPR